MKDGETRYLGDGAYARIEGDMIKVYTDREDGEHYVYFEYETYKTLEAIAKEMWI